MPTAVANGWQFYYEDDTFVPEWQDEPGVVVIEHGLGRSSAFWQSWVPVLASKYRVIRRDMRGHGQSIAIDSPAECSAADLVEDLTSFLSALQLERGPYSGRIYRW